MTQDNNWFENAILEDWSLEALSELPNAQLIQLHNTAAKVAADIHAETDGEEDNPCIDHCFLLMSKCHTVGWLRWAGEQLLDDSHN